jgi:hypothetical protein
VGRIARAVTALAAAAAVAGLLGAAPAAADSKASAPPPNVKYWKGPVTHAAVVELLYWGSWWNKNDDHQSAVKSFLKNYFSGIATPSDRWSPIISQYTDQFGKPTIGFGHGVYDSRLVFTDPVNPPKEATYTQVRAEAAKYALRINKMGLRSEIFLYIMSPAWAHPEGFHNIPASDDFCGRHEAAWYQPDPGSHEAFSFVNLPWVYGDRDCYAYAVSGAPNGALQGFSINAGHEFAETMSDPYWQLAAQTAPAGWTGPDFGWTGANAKGQPTAGLEIGDKCAPDSANPKYQAFFPEKLPTGTFVQEKLWSNAAHGCVQTAAKNAPPLY